MAWGENDPPVKNDFTSDKHAFTYQRKINQLGVNFISEAQDKFRAHDNKPVDEQIIQYTQGQNQKIIKNKIVKNVKEMETMKNPTTEYR